MVGFYFYFYLEAIKSPFLIGAIVPYNEYLILILNCIHVILRKATIYTGVRNDFSRPIFHLKNQESFIIQDMFLNNSKLT